MCIPWNGERWWPSRVRVSRVQISFCFASTLASHSLLPTLSWKYSTDRQAGGDPPRELAFGTLVDDHHGSRRSTDVHLDFAFTWPILAISLPSSSSSSSSSRKFSHRPGVPSDIHGTHIARDWRKRILHKWEKREGKKACESIVKTQARPHRSTWASQWSGSRKRM